MPIKKLYQFLSVLLVIFYFNNQVSALTSGNLRESDNCFYMPNGVAYDAGSSAPAEEAQCSCFAGGYILRLQDERPDTGSWFSDWFPRTFEIYWGRNMWGDTPFIRGPQFTYSSGSDQTANLALCEAAQPKRIYSKITQDCYESVDACKQANKLTCTEGQGGNLFLYWQNPNVTSDFVKQSFNTSQENAKREEFKSCVVGGKTNDACLNIIFGAGEDSRKYNYSNIYRCGCETPWACGIIPGASCERICKLIPAGFSKIAFQEKVDPYNPLLILKVGVDTLFYFAVFLFIINLLSAGFDYLRSGGEADKLKGAQARLTNTIFGFIFILLISTIINYVVTLFEEQILIEDSTTLIIRDKEEKEV